MELKKVLIVSPYFPPVNAADMQRVRMSLPYFRQFGWDAEIVTVDPQYSDLEKDNLLLKSIPPVIHYVAALSKKWTSKLGLGSIALRSIWFFLEKVNALLKAHQYDLIYFSTTQFPVCILGADWKKRFGIPYVIDMQDPWHSDYYQDKPKEQRPSKYWFSYRLNKWLEPIAMRQVAGLISVSQGYINELKNRYKFLTETPFKVITFGVSKLDFEIVDQNADNIKSQITPKPGLINLVYIGRGGTDMHRAVELLFEALITGLSREPDLFKKFKIYFLGTSYAAVGQGSKSIEPLSNQIGLEGQVIEVTDRLGFYETISSLKNSDILFIPGSDDSQYTASKIFPYLMSGKPLLPILNSQSSTVSIIKKCSPNTTIFTFPGNKAEIITAIYLQLKAWAESPIKVSPINQDAFLEYSAETTTKKQVDLFNEAILK